MQAVKQKSILSFFRRRRGCTGEFATRPEDDVVLRRGTYRVAELVTLLTELGGVRTKAPDWSEYTYKWECQGYTIMVNHRFGMRGITYAWLEG